MINNRYPRWIILTSIFLIATSVVLFEMAQVRIFAYSLPPIVAFSGIILAMTGFGIGAMLLSLMPALAEGRLRRTLSIIALLQCVAMIVSSAIFARSSWSAVLEMDSSLVSLVLGVIAPSTVPFFLGGLAIAIAYIQTVEQIGKAYFFSLLGSGIGAVLLVLLIAPLGAERVIGLAASLSATSALILSISVHRKTAVTAAIVLLVALGLFPFFNNMFPFRPDPTDVTGLAIRSAARGEAGQCSRRFDEWNINGRTEIWEQEGLSITAPESTGYRVLTVDSGASTLLVGFPAKKEREWGKELFEDTVYGLAYRANPRPKKVLVVGAGGGIDVQTALHWGAGHITAVEINSSTIKALRGPFADFVKWPLSRRVSLVHADGRGYVRAVDGQFDVIQLSSVDTLTVSATSAFNMIEEYQYTVEAFEDYYKKLKPDGVLGIIRFGQNHARLVAIAYEALLSQGVAEPANHIAAFKQDVTASILVSKNGFNDRQRRALSTVSEPSRVSIPVYENFGMYLSRPVRTIYLPERVDSAHFPTAKQLEILPRIARWFDLPTDDNPFHLLHWVVGQDQMSIRDNTKLIERFLAAIIIVALSSMVLPMIIFSRKLTSCAPLFWILPYFLLIGISFTMFKLGLVSWLSLFVGSSGASNAVVLTTILIAAGLGSFVAEYIGKTPETKIVIGTAIVVVASSALKLSSSTIFCACSSEEFGSIWRGIVAAAMVAPVGFGMGWFFPSGIKAADRYFADQRFKPWAISINCLALVLGSVLALSVAVYFGFRHLFLISLIGYTFACVFSLAFFMKRTSS